VYLVLLAGGLARRRALTAAAATAPYDRDGGASTPVERAIARFAPIVDIDDVVIVADRRHGQAARALAPDALILPEPQPRHTAASIALAAVAIDRPEDETMVVVTVDHDVDDGAGLQAVVSALDADLGGADGPSTAPLATLVVRPASEAEGPSHLHRATSGARRVGDVRVLRVDRLDAHPDATLARELYERGTTYWPAGVFMWTRRAILDALERYTPLLTLIEPAVRSDLALQAAYDRMQPLSIDDAVLVGAAQDAALIMAPVEVGWRPLDPPDTRG
jgi:mannose-1-phosphate guanylyltransferase